MSDTEAMDAIAEELSGEQWTAETLDRVADLVRATGRVVADPADPADPDGA